MTPSSHSPPSLDRSRDSEEPNHDRPAIDEGSSSRTTDPIFVVDENANLVAVDEATCALLGQSLEELLGQTLHDVFVEPAGEELNAILSRIQAGEGGRFRAVHLTRGGRRVSVEVHCHHVHTQGGSLIHCVAHPPASPSPAQGAGEDESKYRALVECMEDMVWVVGPGGNIVETNEAVSRVLGYTREELLGLTIHDIDRDTPADLIRRKGAEVTKGRVLLFETVHTSKSGEKIPVEVQSNLLPFGDERRAMSIVRDIRERKRSEEERLRLEKLESIGLLAGGIAHDFNNLLLASYGHIEMARFELDDDDPVQSYLTAAESTLQRSATLTQQLLTFASGGKPVKKRLEIDALLDEVARFSLRGSTSALVSEIDADLWPVHADPGQLGQIVSNLVINAQQAMPEGGTVTLQARNHGEGDQRQVEIVVGDTGSGIPEHVLDKIFDPYFTTKETGSGLGLAVTHSIVREHAGKITARPRPGGGSEFIVHLPAAEVVEETPQEERTAAAVSEERSGPLDVLVLDDEPAIRALLEKMFKRMGHEVTVVADGSDAVEQYGTALRENSPFDLVLVDLTIPGGLGGEEAARQILNLDPKARIIASSGYSTDPVLAAYSDYGFVGAIAKPYRFEQLRAIIEATREDPEPGSTN